MTPIWLKDSKIDGCWARKLVNTKLKLNYDENLDAKKKKIIQK